MLGCNQTYILPNANVVVTFSVSWDHKFRTALSKFYRRHFQLVSKYNSGLRSLLQQALSQSEFYRNLVYKFRKILGKTEFSNQL